LADADEAQQPDETVAERVEHVAPAGDQQDQRGEADLQPDAGGHQPPVDVALVAGKQPRDTDQHREAEQAEADACQYVHPRSPGADHAPSNGAGYGHGPPRGNRRRQSSRAMTLLPPSSLLWRSRRSARRSRSAMESPSAGLQAIPALKLRYIRPPPRPTTSGRLVSSRRAASIRSQAVPAGCGMTAT